LLKGSLSAEQQFFEREVEAAYQQDHVDLQDQDSLYQQFS
jgi:hypothetical protein